MTRHVRVSACLLAFFVVGTDSARAQDGPLTTADVVQRALERNRDLLAARERVAEAQGLLRQAGVRLAPTVEVEAGTGRPLGTHGEEAYSASYFQPIETASKRTKRMAVSEQSVALTEAELAQRTRDLVFDVKTRVAELQAARRKTEAIARLVSAGRDSYRLTQARVAEGDAAALEERLLATELSRVDAQRATYTGRLTSADLNLRRLIGMVSTGTRTRAIELDPVSAGAYNNRASERMRNRDVDGALADYAMAARLNPRYAQAYRNLGSVKLMKGDLDGAMTEYSRAIGLEPANAQGYFDRANARIETGDIRGAMTDFGEAIQKRSSFAAAYDARGNARRRLGEVDPALEDYNRAIQHNARDPSFYYHRGCTYYDQHAWDSALADFRKAIELDPAGQDFARVRTWLVLMRLGRLQDAATVLAGIVRRPNAQGSDDWVERISGVLTRQIPEREFLDSVHTSYSKTAKGRECQAFFYVGSLRLLKNDLGSARADFERALATGQTTFFEYLSAEAELRGLRTSRRTAASSAR